MGSSQELTVNANFETAAKQIIDVAQRFSRALDGTRIPFRVIGGLAAFLHVEYKDPLAARLTPDVDVAIERGDLAGVCAAVEPHGFRHRNDTGVDMLLLSESMPRSGIVRSVAGAVSRGPGYRVIVS